MIVSHSQSQKTRVIALFVWCQNIRSTLFGCFTKQWHACDRQMDRETDGQKNYNFQDRASIAASRGEPIALNLLKSQTWPNQKLEVDLRRYGRHLIKSIRLHTSVGDHPLCIKFGRPMQNHTPMIVKGSRFKPEV